jgi:hypothetical protein
LYKNVAESTMELTKLNLDDFTETKISVPFHESLYDAVFFSFQDNLYVLYGSTYIDGQSMPSDKRYVYNGAQDTWQEVNSAEFTESVWHDGRIFRRIFNKGNLYLTIGSGGVIFELDGNLNLKSMLGSSQIMLFAYNDKIICRAPNIVNGRTYLYDIYDPYTTITVQFGHSNYGWFFVLGDTIYYHAKDSGTYKTFRMRNDFLNEIL